MLPCILWTCGFQRLGDPPKYHNALQGPHRPVLAPPACTEHAPWAEPSTRSPGCNRTAKQTQRFSGAGDGANRDLRSLCPSQRGRCWKTSKKPLEMLQGPYLSRSEGRLPGRGGVCGWSGGKGRRVCSQRAGEAVRQQAGASAACGLRSDHAGLVGATPREPP